MDRLKAIETFVRIARTGSLTRAARELGTSRALASTHLKQLEDHLGARLLNRTTRQISLTEIGAEYLDFCTRVLALFEQEQAISRRREEPRGMLKILASMAFGNLHLAPAVAEFARLHPDIRVSLIMTDTSFSSFDLIEQGYDLAVWMHAMEDLSVVSSKLREVRWPALATPDYLAAHPRPQRPEDLERHNCLVHRSLAPDGIWRFDDGRVTVKVTGSLFTNSVFALRAAALRHVGIALLPTYAVEAELASGALVPVLEDFAPPRRPIYVLYPHARYLPLKSRLFVDFLRDWVKSRVAE